MNTSTYTTVRIDPNVVALLQARARKARSQAMGNLIGNLVVRLIHKLTPRIDLGVKTAHWG